MPRNHRIASSASKVHNMLGARPPRLSILPLQSVVQPATVQAPNGVRNYSLFKWWKGSSTEEHSVNRSNKGDTHDPATEASVSGRKEREVNEGIADETKSQGMTQRGGLKHGQKAKEEHPAAPEPIIGMNDERAEKGH